MDLYEFKANLVYRVSSTPAMATYISETLSPKTNKTLQLVFLLLFYLFVLRFTLTL